MKIAVIGDIHGTKKFIEGYADILKNNNDVDKIVVLGDHFDPYESIPLDVMAGRYHEFTECMKGDDRIVSILGNHDLSGYIISGDSTNRTYRDSERRGKIREMIESNLHNSRIMFECGDYLFSHAGVSAVWFDDVARPLGYTFESLQKTGWTPDELSDLVHYCDYDYSGWGNNAAQGPTWLRPPMLVKHPYGEYNQAVGHTMLCYKENRDYCFGGDAAIEEHGSFYAMTMENGKTVWFVDNDGKNEYLVLDVID